MINNPILPPHSADPWMIFHGGCYYYCQSANGDTGIRIRKSSTLAGIAHDEGVVVWNAPRRGQNSREVWAPEIHFIEGKFFIYYAADDGDNANHRMWVLESETDNPLGGYICRGCLETEGWAIDGTPLVAADGRMFFVWSGWPGKRNGQQNLYIAPMSNPFTVSGKRVLVCEPDQKWERIAMPICEGPQVLQNNGKIFIVYSASGSWTEDYCLGLLTNTDGDVLNPASWVKRPTPVFQKTEHVWGLGHCSFVKSPCQTQDFIVYHAKSSKKEGWADRDVHAKAFAWTAEGLPDFGVPAPRARTLAFDPNWSPADANLFPKNGNELAA
jgi:GH43 family beta-xylosidase